MLYRLTFVGLNYQFFLVLCTKLRKIEDIIKCKIFNCQKIRKFAWIENCILSVKKDYLFYVEIIFHKINPGNYYYKRFNFKKTLIMLKLYLFLTDNCFLTLAFNFTNYRFPINLFLLYNLK